LKTRKALYSIALSGTCILVGCTGSIGGSTGGGSSGPGTSGVGAGTTTGTGGSTTTGGPNAICQPSTNPRIWRLSDEEYVNAVSDLLPGSMVPDVTTPGRTKGEFINMSERLPVTGALASNLRTSAKAVATQAVANLTGLLNCQPGQSDMACASAFVDRFVPRAFRRPIDAAEKDALLAVYAMGAQTTSADGIELLLEAVLQSPSFLYRTELGGGATAGKPTALSSYELATALSFLVTDSIPDEELWRVAQDGSLSMPAVFAAQVDRLLATARAHDNIARIFLKWLGLGAGVTVELSATDYPEYDDMLRQSMLEESTRFLSGLLSQNGTYADLMSSRKTFVDARLAGIYGVPYNGTGFVETTLPPERSGILTQAGIVASKSRGHPIVIRGKFVRRDLFCQDIPSPPPTVNIQMFSGMGLTERQQASARAANQVCGGCHRMMDPIGISFEKYDALARYKPTAQDGSAVDSAGSLDGTDVDGPIGSPLELAARIGKSDSARVCVSKQMLAYALGRELTTADQCEQDRVAAQVDVLGGHLSDLIGAIVRSPVFGFRTGGP
jgi:Protein of unknown function (DUF1592)/Protein of unknown function (DUF1588)/Protein of unknown function (DUF1595)/Protein of unknown function (DUF1585)